MSHNGRESKGERRTQIHRPQNNNRTSPTASRKYLSTCYAHNFYDEVTFFLCHTLSGADCFPASSCQDCGLDPDDPRGCWTDACHRGCDCAHDAGAHRSACSSLEIVDHFVIFLPGTDPCAENGCCCCCCYW